MKHKVKITNWQNNKLQTTELFFDSLQEAINNLYKYEGNIKIYDNSGLPVYSAKHQHHHQHNTEEIYA
jgi:hypothetical protein